MIWVRRPQSRGLRESVWGHRAGRLQGRNLNPCSELIQALRSLGKRQVPEGRLALCPRETQGSVQQWLPWDGVVGGQRAQRQESSRSKGLCDSVILNLSGEAGAAEGQEEGGGDERRLERRGAGRGAGMQVRGGVGGGRHQKPLFPLSWEADLGVSGCSWATLTQEWWRGCSQPEFGA